MPETARLLPDSDQHEVLRSTLQRVNRACNAVRTVAAEQGVAGGAGLRSLVKAEADRFKLPAALHGPMRVRVEESLTGPPGRRQRFGEYQSLVLPTLKWPASDRVSLPTAAGRRTVRVYVDPRRGGLRHPLEDQAVALVFRNGEFELVAVGT